VPGRAPAALGARGAGPRQHPAPAGLRALDRPGRLPLAAAAASGRARIVGVELAEDAVRLADLPAARRRTIAVLGHEQTGIPPEAVDLLDVAVEIPMVGSGASLNVAVAGSLVLYRLAGLL